MASKGYRIGDNLIIDEITGEEIFYSNSYVDAYGRRTSLHNGDKRNPIEKLKTMRERLPNYTSGYQTFDKCFSFPNVPGTNIPLSVGAAQVYIESLGGGDVGIGKATIGCSFIVR